MPEARDLSVIRQALVRELETINHYQDLHDQAGDPAVRQLMLHLMDEEKEHVAELTSLLRAMDSVQDRSFSEEHSQAISAGHLEALAKLAAPAPAKEAVKAPEGLTIGSLIGIPII